MHNETSSIEAVERYWSASPCNVRRSRNTPGTLAFFDDIARNKRLVEPHGAAFADFPAWAGKIVVDAGCGLGTDLVSFADHGAEVVGVDVSTFSLELARKNLQRHGLMHRCLALLNQDFEQLELTGTGAMEPDLIWSFGAIHHTPNPVAALLRLHGVAGPRTLLRCMLYHRRSWKWLAEMRGDGSRSEAVDGCPVTFAYSREEAWALLEATGWRVRRLFVDHIFRYRIPDYIEGRYRERLGWRLLPRPVIRAIERNIGWHILIEAEAK